MTSKCSHVMRVRFQLKNQTNNLKVAVCSSEDLYVVTLKYRLVSMSDQSSVFVLHSVLYFLESGQSNDQM